MNNTRPNVETHPPANDKGPNIFGEKGIYNNLLKTIHTPGIGIAPVFKQKLAAAKKTLPLFKTKITNEQAQEIAAWLKEQFEKLSIPGITDFLIKTQHNSNDDRNVVNGFLKYVKHRDSLMGKAVESEIMVILINNKKNCNR
jgi:hypothetical protein